MTSAWSSQAADRAASAATRRWRSWAAARCSTQAVEHASDRAATRWSSRGANEARRSAFPTGRAPDMGPLGGIAAGAALRPGDTAIASVLTCGVDSLGFARRICANVAPPPPLLSCRPAGDRPLAGRAAGAMRRRSFRPTGNTPCGRSRSAIRRQTGENRHKPANINTPADLAAAEKNVMGYERQADFGTPEVKSDEHGHADHRRPRSHRARRHHA